MVVAVRHVTDVPRSRRPVTNAGRPGLRGSTASPTSGWHTWSETRLNAFGHSDVHDYGSGPVGYQTGGWLTHAPKTLHALAGIATDSRAFWSRSRQSRVSITDGDDAEDTFTAEVDAASTDTVTP
ncbi:hypothetical protein [Actinomadura chokoriensis]|uniref:Uncharacterized protein n=1 Tax=Actinomadura chokoriensis TaxID=454156 RepID=A0ABV4QW91_9ACTN